MENALFRNLRSILELLLFTEHTIGSYAGRVPNSSFEVVCRTEYGHFFIQLDIYPSACFEETVRVQEFFLDTDYIDIIFRDLERIYKKPPHPYLFFVCRRYYQKLVRLNENFFVYDKMIYYKQIPLKYIVRTFDPICGDYKDSDETQLKVTFPVDVLQTLFEDADAFGVKTSIFDEESLPEEVKHLPEEFVEGSLTIEDFFTTTAGYVKSLDGYDFLIQKVVCLIVIKGGNPGGVLM
jgi:hypothetical protein